MRPSYPREGEKEGVEMAESKPNKQEFASAASTAMMEPEQESPEMVAAEVGIAEEIIVKTETAAANVIAEKIAEKVNVSVSDKTVAKADNTVETEVVDEKFTSTQVNQKLKDFSSHCDRMTTLMDVFEEWANSVARAVQKGLLEEAAAIRASAKDANELALSKLTPDDLAAAAAVKEEQSKLVEVTREVVLDEVAATCKLVEGARHQLDEALPRDKEWMSCSEQLGEIGNYREVIDSQASDVKEFVKALDEIWEKSPLSMRLGIPELVLAAKTILKWMHNKQPKVPK